MPCCQHWRGSCVFTSTRWLEFSPYSALKQARNGTVPPFVFCIVYRVSVLSYCVNLQHCHKQYNKRCQGRNVPQRGFVSHVAENPNYTPQPRISLVLRPFHAIVWQMLELCTDHFNANKFNANRKDRKSSVSYFVVLPIARIVLYNWAGKQDEIKDANFEGHRGGPLRIAPAWVKILVTLSNATGVVLTAICFVHWKGANSCQKN